MGEFFGGDASRNGPLTPATFWLRNPWGMASHGPEIEDPKLFHESVHAYKLDKNFKCFKKIPKLRNLILGFHASSFLGFFSWEQSHDDALNLFGMARGFWWFVQISGSLGSSDPPLTQVGQDGKYRSEDYGKNVRYIYIHVYIYIHTIFTYR